MSLNIILPILPQIQTGRGLTSLMAKIKTRNHAEQIRITSFTCIGPLTRLPLSLVHKSIFVPVLPEVGKALQVASIQNNVRKTQEQGGKLTNLMTSSNSIFVCFCNVCDSLLALLTPSYLSMVSRGKSCSTKLSTACHRRPFRLAFHALSLCWSSDLMQDHESRSR